MEMVALDHSLARHWPHEISGGQQQRVALARALAQQPALMLLDEPFSALDTGLRASTRKATADLLAETGIASILVTHDQTEALSFATQVAVMRQGRFAQVGTPLAVLLAAGGRRDSAVSRRCPDPPRTAEPRAGQLRAGRPGDRRSASCW